MKKFEIGDLVIDPKNDKRIGIIISIYSHSVYEVLCFPKNVKKVIKDWFIEKVD